MSVADILQQMAANAGRAQLVRGALIGNTIAGAAGVPGQIIDDREKEQIRQAAQARLNAQDARGAAQDARQTAADVRQAAAEARDQAAREAAQQRDTNAKAVFLAGTGGDVSKWDGQAAYNKSVELGDPSLVRDAISLHKGMQADKTPTREVKTRNADGSETVRIVPDVPAEFASAAPPAPAPKPGTIHDTPNGLVRIGDDNTVTPLGVKGYHPPVADPNGGLGGPPVNLSTLPPQIRDQAQALVDGRRALDPRLQGKPLGQTIINAAYAIDPTFDTANFNARSKARADLTSPSGTGGKAISALNTAIQHAGKLSDLIETLDNYESPLANAIVNPIRTATGSTKVTNYDTVAPQLAKEIERVWRGTGGTAGEIHDLVETIGHNKGKQQQREALQQFVDLAKGKLDSLEQQRDNVMGKTAGASIPVLFDQNKPIMDTIAQRAGVAPPKRIVYDMDGKPVK